MDSRPCGTATFGKAELTITGTRSGYVATGTIPLDPPPSGFPGPDGVGVAFRSTDGTMWEPAVVDAAHGLGQVFVARDGLLASGSSHGPTGAIVRPEYWHSVDGRHWQEVPDTSAAATRLGARLAADGDRIYAVTPQGSEWSSDGLTWHPLDMFIEASDPRSMWSPYQLAAGPGGLVESDQTDQLGKGDPSDQTDALIWQAVPGEPPTGAVPMPTPAPEHDMPCPTARQNADGTCG